MSRRSTSFAISSARSIASRRSARRDPVEVREDEQVLLDGQRHVEVVELRRDAAAAARACFDSSGQREAEHLELALVGDRLRGQQPHRRRLAGAVRAEQADARALRHVEVEPVDGGDRPVALDDAAQADGELALTSVSLPGSVARDLRSAAADRPRLRGPSPSCARRGRAARSSTAPITAAAAAKTAPTRNATW